MTEVEQQAICACGEPADVGDAQGDEEECGFFCHHCGVEVWGESEKTARDKFNEIMRPRPTVERVDYDLRLGSLALGSATCTYRASKPWRAYEYILKTHKDFPTLEEAMRWLEGRARLIGFNVKARNGAG